MGERKAAEAAGMMIGKSGRTIREWRSFFFSDKERSQSVNKATSSINEVESCG